MMLRAGLGSRQQITYRLRKLTVVRGDHGVDIGITLRRAEHLGRVRMLFLALLLSLLIWTGILAFIV